MSWIIKSLVAIGVATAGAAAKADTLNDGSQNQAKRAFISEYDNALAPLQFVKFCMNYDAECAADTAERTLPSGERAMSMLREVNSSVNASITPMQKSTNPMVARWTLAPSAGDCNDYAVTKRHPADRDGLAQIGAATCSCPDGRQGPPCTGRASRRRRLRSRQSFRFGAPLERGGL
ncbi:transglutaminase-like cysteine peptidase [Bradyrhizobium diazoefficiens]